MSKAVKITPMLQQYLEIKEQQPEAILFYRMGDFYEMFFEDAVEASRILGITLTSRSAKDEANRVPMCGVPYHAAQSYLAKLIQAGRRVAICEQVEDPAQAKGIVKREVVRVVSPGVVTDDQLLDDKDNLYLAAICRQEEKTGSRYGVSFLDLSTGDFRVGEFVEQGPQAEQILDQLTRMTPAELLLSDQEEGLEALMDQAQVLLPGLCITHRSQELFDLDCCREALQEQFKVNSLAGFGCRHLGPGLIAAGVLLQYLQETQKTDLGHLERLAPIDLDHVLQIDDSSRRNLELTQTVIGGKRQGSLLSVLDQTKTPMGARLLKQRLLFPLRDVAQIRSRLDAVEDLLQNSRNREGLRELLVKVDDTNPHAGHVNRGHRGQCRR